MRVEGSVQSCLFVSLATALLAPSVSLATDREASPVPRGEAPQHPPAVTSRYGRVLIEPLELGYTKKFLTKRKLRDHRLEGKDLEQVQRHFREVATGKIRSKFPIASEPASDVIRVDAVLWDQTLDKRDWLSPTRFTFRGGPKVQLIVALRDSQTGRIVDIVGLTIRPQANRLMYESPGFYWHFMRRVFDRISTRVIWALEDGGAKSS